MQVLKGAKQLALELCLRGLLLFQSVLNPPHPAIYQFLEVSGVCENSEERPTWSSEGRVGGWDSLSALQRRKQVGGRRLVTKRPQLATGDC